MNTAREEYVRYASKLSGISLRDNTFNLQAWP
jgi:hypothetical protein